MTTREVKKYSASCGHLTFTISLIESTSKGGYPEFYWSNTEVTVTEQETFSSVKDCSDVSSENLIKFALQIHDACLQYNKDYAYYVEQAKQIKAQCFYVYDVCEHRAWGPFSSHELAEKFIEDDPKYLQSWGHVIQDLSLYNKLSVYPPDQFNSFRQKKIT